MMADKSFFINEVLKVSEKAQLTADTVKQLKSGTQRSQ